ncbi:MAG: pseudouridine synthase [Bacteroidota bacterium]
MRTSGKPPKKNNVNRSEKPKKFETKSFDKPKFSKSSDKKYSDRKPYKSREAETTDAEKPKERYANKRTHDDTKSLDKKPYKSKNTEKFDSGRPRERYTDNKNQDDKKYSDRKPYKSRDAVRAGGDKSRERYTDKRNQDDKKSYKSRDNEKTFTKRPIERYADKRKFDDSKYSDDKSYKSRETEKADSDRPIEKYVDKRSPEEKRSGATKPYNKYSNDRNFDDKKKRPRIVESKTYEGRARERRDVDILVKDNTYSKRPSFKTASDGGIRLNKFIANAGVCSRREADILIETGVITINGKIVTQLGTKVMPEDEVRFNDQLLRGEQLQYLLLNKPKGYITTTDDPQERKTVMLIVEKACKERIYPVGRLDKNTSGLLLFTNDGELAKKLTHPKHRVEKVYHVELDKTVSPADLKKIADGMELDDGLIEVDAVAYGESKKECGIELHSGKNRIVRRIFEHLGYEVVKLDRVVFAGLTKKELPRGKYRFLSNDEVNILRRIS